MDQSEEVDLEHLIVDVCQEQRLGSILSLCQGVMPVLSLGKVNNSCLCKMEMLMRVPTCTSNLWIQLVYAP